MKIQTIQTRHFISFSLPTGSKVDHDQSHETNKEKRDKQRMKKINRNLKETQTRQGNFKSPSKVDDNQSPAQLGLWPSTPTFAANSAEN